MENYEQLAILGEGSYGLVIKCRHRASNQIVAVKKFLETEEDSTVRAMALREIRMLKKMRHENIVTMIEVFRFNKRFYLVFEYMEGTILDEIESNPEGLGDDKAKERIFQICRAIQYCHSRNIIHRDVKPENVLVSSNGIVKLCDFGFARLIGGQGETYTEYVATRWYRAPELLVGENPYGPAVDIWAIGCLFAEMLLGEPLFSGDSDIDQLYLIVKLMGKPCIRHQKLISKNMQLRSIKKSVTGEPHNIYVVFPDWTEDAIDFLSCCLKMDPHLRPTSEELLKHKYFVSNKFIEKFMPILREKLRLHIFDNPLLKKIKMERETPEHRKEEFKIRRSIYTDTPQWKFNFLPEGVKRKLSIDTQTSESNGECKSNQKLSSVNKLGQLSKNTLQSLKKDEKTQVNGSESFPSKQTSQSLLMSKNLQESSKGPFRPKDNRRLEKALDLLTKLTQRSQQIQQNSTNKFNILTPSPPQFQPLQRQNFRDISKSTPQHAYLQPTINNITFDKETKKPSFTMQNVNKTSIKSVFNQIPLNNPPKNQPMKRLDRPVVVNTCSTVSFNGKSPPDWLNSVGTKRDPWKGKQDFTLPLVPGASGSPGNQKKKASPRHHVEMNTKTSTWNMCGDNFKLIPHVTLKPIRR